MKPFFKLKKQKSSGKEYHPHYHNVSRTQHQWLKKREKYMSERAEQFRQEEKILKVNEGTRGEEGEGERAVLWP